MIEFRGLILVECQESRIRVDSIYLSMYNVDSKKDSFG